jgi:hypothetical protein
MSEGKLSKHWPWVITVFLTAVFWLHTCNLNREIAKGKEQISQLDLSNQELKTITSKQGQTIFRQESIISDNTKSLNKLTDTIFDLRKKDSKNLETIAYYKEVTRTTLRVDVPYLDSVAMQKFSDSVSQNCAEVIQYIHDSTVKVPANIRTINPFFSLDATVKREGLSINALVIPDTLQLRFVEHKKFMKPNTVEVQYKHSNPLVQSQSANSAFYKPKKKSFFQRVILPVSVGLGVGLIIAK